MAVDVAASLRDLEDSLGRGDWASACAAGEAALAAGADAEAWAGLGSALWWLGETEGAVHAQERAYAAFRRRPDPAGAALTAMSLCLLYRASLGNHAASRGWLHRFAAVVEQAGLGSLTGWVSLCRAVAANDLPDPAAAAPAAREALAVARAGGDPDLELCALSELGTALVLSGRAEEGVELLDEAMAGALAGESRRPETVVFTGCRSVTCCCWVTDAAHAAQWVRAADDFTRRYGGLHMYTVCRAHYGRVLLATGDWPAAERELREALRVGRTAERAMYAEALAALAELEVARGHLDGAAELLVGYGELAVTARARGALHLRCGDPAAAATVLRRALDGLPVSAPDWSATAELLAGAELDLDRVPDASQVALAMARGVAGRDRRSVARARTDAALGRVHSARAETPAARRHLERALATFGALGLPLEGALTHLALAEALEDADPGAAVADARAALETCDRLGAGPDADRALRVLRRLGVRTVRRVPGAGGPLSPREQEVLALLAEGLTNPEVAARLYLSRKTVEHHVHGVFTKLGLRNRAEATAWVLRHPEQVFGVEPGASGRVASTGPGPAGRGPHPGADRGRT